MKLPKMHRVGSLPFLEDGSITPQDIKEMSKTNPALAIRHANISPELFAELAREFPFEATNNPTLPLWDLETPGFWRAIVYKNINHWIESQLERLPSSDQTEFYADCAERVIPLFEASYPEDDRPRNCIKTARRWLQGLATDDELAVAQRAVSDSYLGSQDLVSSAAATACMINNGSYEFAPSAKGYLASRNKYSNEFKEAAFDEELWQWNLLVTKYLPRLKQSHKVGAAWTDDDLSITDEQLRREYGKLPWEIVQHPNISPELFIEIARDYPLQAIRNPSLQLWLLEDPEFWTKIEKKYAHEWIKSRLGNLSAKEMVAFGFECVERLHHVYERNSNSHNNINAMNMVKLWLDDMVKVQDVVRLRRGCSEGIYRIVDSVALATGNSTEHTKESIMTALDWAADARAVESNRSPGTAENQNARLQEYIWQWHHLLDKYLQPSREETAGVGYMKPRNKSLSHAPRGFESFDPSNESSALSHHSSREWPDFLPGPEFTSSVRGMESPRPVFDYKLPMPHEPGALATRHHSKVSGMDVWGPRHSGQSVGSRANLPTRPLPPLPSFEKPKKGKSKVGAVQLWEGAGLSPLAYVGRKMKEPSMVEVQHAIDRAYAYWFGWDAVGAAKAEKEARKKYLASLSPIKDYKRQHTKTLTDLGILRHWAEDHELMELVQEVTGESPGYYNIMRLAEEATPEEREHWVKWYQHASEDVRRLMDKHNRNLPSDRKLSFPVVAAVVAVLSPGNSWVNNLAAADHILTHRTGEGSSAYRANAEKALKMLAKWDTSEVSGPKVTVFFESLRRPLQMEEHVVLDGHMINIWRGVKRKIQNTRQPTKLERAQMIYDFNRASDTLGISPQAVQALTWYIWRYSVEQPHMSAKILKETRDAIMANLQAQKAKRHQSEEAVRRYHREEEEFYRGHNHDDEDVRGMTAVGRTLPSANGYQFLQETQWYKFQDISSNSNKFWTIRIDGAHRCFSVTFGRIGSAGQTKKKCFRSAAKMMLAAQKLIDSKRRKGYVLVAMKKGIDLKEVTRNSNSQFSYNESVKMLPAKVAGRTKIGLNSDPGDPFDSDPERNWAPIIKKLLNQLPEEQQLQWGVDCLHHILPEWKRLFPNRDSFPKAIAIWEDYAAGNVNPHHIPMLVTQVFPELFTTNNEVIAAFASAAFNIYPENLAEQCALAMEMAQDLGMAFDVERTWQYNRLKKYVNGDAVRGVVGAKKKKASKKAKKNTKKKSKSGR